MPSPSDRWQGPHAPFPVEAAWDEFVHQIGGKRITELVANPTFENADYLFDPPGIVAELKEITTEFNRSSAFRDGYRALIARAIAEIPGWKPDLVGGRKMYPAWFVAEFARLFRPHISRILKKANRQLRETKAYL